MIMIRQATIHDLDQLTKLFDLYRQFYKLESNALASKIFLEERLKNQQSIIFVSGLVKKPELINAFVQLYPTFSSLYLRKSWILNDLFVDPEHRRQGLAEELLKKSVNFSKDSGARLVMLQTARDNFVAQKLYEKLGWVRDEKFYSYYSFH